MTQDNAQELIGIRESNRLITEHYPAVKCELAELTDVGCLSWHHHLWHFSLQGVDVMGSVGMDAGFELSDIGLEWFQRTGTDRFPTSSFLKLSDDAYGSILPGQ